MHEIAAMLPAKTLACALEILECLMNLQDSLTPIPVVHLLKHPHLFQGVEVHVRVAEKFVKLNFAQDSFTQILDKLKDKGVIHVYLHEEDFSKVIAHFQNTLSSKSFYDPTTTDEQKVEVSATAMTLARDFIKTFGVNKEVIEVMKAANGKIQEILGTSPGLHAFVKRFKNSCSEEFLKVNVTNFLAGMLIDQFPWKSPLIVQKTMLAGMMCDITLSPADFEAIKRFETDGTPLDETVRRHPLAVAEILTRKRDLIPAETITIVEQHHERPDGKGFPHGITTTRFNQLSAIFIVSQRFVDMLFESQFDYKKHHEMIQRLKAVYHGGPFDKTLDALINTVDK